MSKIGNKPIKVPDGVKVSVANNVINFEGKMGKLSMNIYDGFNLEIKDGFIYVRKTNDKLKVMHGTLRAKIANAVLGVSEGFKKVLEIVGVGFRAQTDGKTITMQLGFSHPTTLNIPSGIKVEVDPKTQNIITVSGVDKELVGNFADKLRKIKPPEPYKGSGIRYQGERIIRKAGKSHVSGGGAKK
jgi:large subunit ribosomal protein L6